MVVTVWWPSSVEWYGIDVTVRYAGASRYVGAQRKPGAAAARAEKEKKARYGRDVLPLAFEAGGRLGLGSEATLQRLATAAVASSGGVLTRRGLLARWRRRLECSLFFAAADAVLCALGRSEKGAQLATHLCSGREPIADHGCTAARVSCPPVVDAPDQSTGDLDCEEECLQEGLEALLAEDEEAAQYLHTGGT